MGSSATRPGERCGAHRGLERTGEAAQDGRRRGPSGGDGRRSRRKLLHGLSGLLGSTGQRVGLLRRCYGGQGGLGITGGEESRGRSVSLAAASGSIPARPGLGVEGRSFRKLPGGEAELLRGLWWPGAWRSGLTTVRPRRPERRKKRGGGAIDLRATQE
jgi:hypothetical protein